jgi:competence protein ComEA
VWAWQAGSLLYIGASLLLGASYAHAQLPDGPGKVETEKVCTQCHDLARSISLHQDRAGWQATMDKMAGMGAQGSDKEFKTIVDYLTQHYPAEDVPLIRVNSARAIDFESGLTLRRSQAAAIVEYRNKNGPFKSIDDLKKVPGIDAAKIDAKKDRLLFDQP